MILISIKKLEVCKVYFYYEAMLVVLEQFLPKDMNAETANFILMIMQILNFLLHYFDWWPSLVTSMLTLVVQMIGRAVFHDEPIDAGRIITLLISMIWLAGTLLGMHIIITKVGMIFVNAEILSTGNE